jgi:hypothetical protein
MMDISTDDIRTATIQTAIIALDNAVQLMLQKDGDRDHMNRSDLNCEQSMAICGLLKVCKSILEKIAAESPSG